MSIGKKGGRRTQNGSQLGKKELSGPREGKRTESGGKIDQL